MRYLIVIAVLLVALPLSAQGPGPVGLRQHDIVARSELNSASARALTSATHWQEGMIIGGVFGVLVGALGVSLNNSLCETSDCHVTAYYFIGPILIFSIIGGLIGSGFPKH